MKNISSVSFFSPETPFFVFVDYRLLDFSDLSASICTYRKACLKEIFATTCSLLKIISFDHYSPVFNISDSSHLAEVTFQSLDSFFKVTSKSQTPREFGITSAMEPVFSPLVNTV